MCDNCSKKPQGRKPWKELNKEHFDNQAEDTFKPKWIQEMHRQIIEWLQTNHAWFGIPEDACYEAGTGVRIMDYACGNGILSRTLAPYASHIRGVDISSSMVKLYNESAANVNLGPGRMRAVEADLTSGGEPSLSEAAIKPEFDMFDVAFISLALHHVEDPVAVLRGMATRVAPGGKILVIDWKTPTDEEMADYDRKKADAMAVGDGVDECSHSHNVEDKARKAIKTVVHRGFGIEQMHDFFFQAGLVNSAVQMHPNVSEAPSIFGGPMHLFYALAEKPM